MHYQSVKCLEKLCNKMIEEKAGVNKQNGHAYIQEKVKVWGFEVCQSLGFVQVSVMKLN